MSLRHKHGDVDWNNGSKSVATKIAPWALCGTPEEVRPFTDRLNTYLERKGEWHKARHKRDGRKGEWHKAQAQARRARGLLDPEGAEGIRDHIEEAGRARRDACPKP